MARASVSKTEGRGFESCHPCQTTAQWRGFFVVIDGKSYYAYDMAIYGLIALIFGLLGATVALIVVRFKTHTVNLSSTDLIVSTLLKSMGDAVFLIDGRGIINAANAPAQLLTGQTSSPTGIDFFTILTAFTAQAQPIDMKMMSTAAFSQNNVIDGQLKNAQGQILKLQYKITPVLVGRSNKAQGYIVTIRDLTHEKTIDQQRNEFISVVSHELRTPIAIVEGSVSTIMNDKLIPFTPSQQKMIKTAYDKVLYLAEIVNNLNMVLQTENKTIDTTYKTVAPNDLMHRLLLIYQPIAKQKNISLSIDQLTNRQLLTDSQFLQEILTSYLSNAIEYTPANGQVLLSAFEQKDGVVFRVSDTGPGISPSDQRMLFKKFFRTEDYRVKTTTGTGLSLYIAKQLADRLGGRVWCESLLGHGSRFFVFIPFAATLTKNPAIISADVHEALEGI